MGRILIIKFSPLLRDPRVLRQIRTLIEAGHEVWTIGHGEAPPGVTHHHSVPSSYSFSMIQKGIVAAKLLSRPVNKRYAHWPEVRAALPWLREHRDKFDAVLTNDVITVPLALASGAPVHADLHDFALGQDVTLAWKLGPLPIVQWASGFLARVASASTTSPGMRDLYIRESERDSFLVLNSPRHYPDLQPTKTALPIRLVYMGVAAKRRQLDLAISAVTALNRRRPGAVTLDYYLVPGEPKYIVRLKRLAGDAATTGVSVKDPVEFDRIVETLHKYDVALAFFPPTTLSLKTTLPNKFFEAVQARIGVITGPSPQMTPYLAEFGFGEATAGWDRQDLEDTLEQLTPEKVDSWKSAAANAAAELSGETQDLKWLEAVTRIMELDRQ